MLTFNSILKAVPLDNVSVIISTDGTEHYFILSESGSLMYLRPKDGLCKVISNHVSSNSYGTIGYSYTSNCAYFFYEDAPILTEIDLNTLDVKVYNYSKYMDNYVNNFIQTGSVAIGSQVHYIKTATDGNIWFASIKYIGFANIIKFNTVTKEFSTPGLHSDIEFECLYGRGSLDCIHINNGPVGLRGYYTRYLMTDTYEDLYDTLISELNSSGLSYALTSGFEIWLHWDDRDLGSSTRRVITKAPNFKIIDLKSTSVFIDSGTSTTISVKNALLTLNTWVDNTASDVDEDSWIMSTIANNAVALGITNPSFSPGYHYTLPTFIGRFPYHAGNYMANKAIWNHFAYSPTTGKILFPNSFNKLETYLNNERILRVFWANMPSSQGFSGSPEYVAFVANDSGDLGYHRPDTEVWVEYNPYTDVDNYIIAEVDLNDPTDVYGLGCHVNEALNVVEYRGQDWLQSDYCKSAINPVIQTIIDPLRNFAEVRIEYTPDITKGVSAIAKFNGVSTLTGIVHSAYQINDKYIFGGRDYSGISIGEVPITNYVQDHYFGETISFYGSIRWGSLVVFYGYLSNVEIIDPVALTQERRAIGLYVNQQIGAAVRTTEAIFCGVQVRTARYKNDYFAMAYINTAYNIFPFINLPPIINTDDTIELRTATGLTAASYSDIEVNNAILAYQITTGLTRDQVIDLFLQTTPYRSQDVIAYDDFVIVNLKHLGVSGLTGIRINREEDMSGDWVDETYNNFTRFPTIVRFEKADLSTLVEADYKIITLDIAGFETYNGLGRMYQTDSYVCWFYKEGTNLFFKAISKANIEAATTEINSFDKEVMIPLGTSTGGWGNYTSFFGGNDRFLNFCFSEGDNIYASFVGSIAGDGDWIIAMKIDVVAQTYEPFLSSSDRTTVTTMTYNPDTDDCVVSRGTSAKMYENISVASLPLAY